MVITIWDSLQIVKKLHKHQFIIISTLLYVTKQVNLYSPLTKLPKHPNSLKDDTKLDTSALFPDILLSS